jgi:tetratricopeptide (TPR) repeat protein
MTLGQTQLTQRNYDAAINSFARAAKIKPDLLVESLEGMTQAYEAAGRYSEALQSCKQLSELKPTSGPLHSKLAHLYALQGSAAEATLEHRKAMQYANETYFLAQHGHTPTFTEYCSGRLVVKPGGVEYSSADSAEKIKLTKKALQDVVQSSFGFQAQIKTKNPISFRFASQKGQEMSVFFRIVSEVLR